MKDVDNKLERGNKLWRKLSEAWEVCDNGIWGNYVWGDYVREDGF